MLIIAMTLCCFIVGQGLNSGTSVYVARLGGTATYAGLLAAVFSVAAAVTRVVCGPVVDKRGRWCVMAVGLAVLVAGTAIPVFTQNEAAFVVCRFLQGIGFSASTTAAATAAADVLPLSRLGEGIGYYGLGQALAMSIGPALALFLVGTEPAENLYVGLAAVAAIGLAVTFACRYENNPARLPETSAYRRRWEAAHAGDGAAAAGVRAADGQAEAETAVGAAVAAAENEALREAAAEGDTTETAADEPPARGIRRIIEPRALPGTLPMLILSPAFGFGIFFVGLYGTTLGVGNAGLFYTLSAVSMIAVRVKSQSFMDRVAPIKVLTAAILAGLAAYGLLLAAPASELLYYTAGIFYGICIGIAMPLNQSVAVKNTPASRWGATNALFFLATDVGIGCASVVWGFVNDAFGFGTTILCVVGCIIASYLVAWVVYPKENLAAIG